VCDGTVVGRQEGVPHSNGSSPLAIAVADAAKADGCDTLNAQEQADVATYVKQAQDVAPKIREADESTALLRRSARVQIRSAPAPDVAGVPVAARG
jgi:hypothetical protein